MDPLSATPIDSQLVAGRRRDRSELGGPIDERDGALLEQVPDPGHRAREVVVPLVGVHMGEQAHPRSPPPQRREERDAVGHVDEEVPVGEATSDQRGAQVLRVGAPKGDHRVVVILRGPTAHQRGLVAPLLQRDRQAIDDDLGPTGLGMSEIAPGHEEDAHAVGEATGW